jgi:hypothetical protein
LNDEIVTRNINFSKFAKARKIAIKTMEIKFDIKYPHKNEI